MWAVESWIGELVEASELFVKEHVELFSEQRAQCAAAARGIVQVLPIVIGWVWRYTVILTPACPECRGNADSFGDHQVRL